MQMVHKEEESLGGAEFLKWGEKDPQLKEQEVKWTGLGTEPSLHGKEAPTHRGILLFPGLYCILERKVGNLVILYGNRATEGKLIPADQDGAEEDQITSS